ncbi:DUF7344 domain-containing protein [Haloarcula amylovorans]|uniref:DUF7344 domain-containing protein n=1 Tax=Haloarcula amylovorans TaxID=2562280 RepID=UPI0010765F67|nr:hypothetical protein [Halomicroarcula amylolytica]
MVDVSSLFELLAADYRRQILIVLCDSESVDVPAGLLLRSASAGGTPSEAPGWPATTGEKGALPLELVHVHLPKLAEADLVEWDQSAGVVSRGPAFDEVEPFVRVLVRNAETLPGDLL